MEIDKNNLDKVMGHSTSFTFDEWNIRKQRSNAERHMTSIYTTSDLKKAPSNGPIKFESI